MQKPVKKLYTETVAYMPREEGFGDSMRYAHWEPVISEKIREAIDKGEDEYEYYYPMMNYWYPLPNSFERDIGPEKAADILAKSPLNLTLIYDNEADEYGLTLTGGGMDLSWDICEAYMRLGYLPPAHFCDLPNFAGMKLTRRVKWVLAGCRRSLLIQRFRANYSLEKLRGLRAELKVRE